MANTKISALTALTNPTGNEELVYAYNNANGKMTLDTMKTFASAGSQATLVSGVNIKTINNTSILGSGNIDVSGGGGGGGFEPTELGGDANIWELSEGAYVTSYDLYYSTGNKISTLLGTGNTKRQMLFVVESSGTKGYFVYNGCSRSGVYDSNAAFGYSTSSSDGICRVLDRWDAAIRGAIQTTTGQMDAIYGNTFSQVISSYTEDNSTLRTSSSNPVYAGMTYTIYVSSYASGHTATVTVGSGVTNPLNISLPTNSNKPFIITLLATSTTEAIVTGCTIQN